MIYIIISAVILIIAVLVCVCLFVPHTLSVAVNGKNVAVRFGVFTVHMNNKKHKKKKKEEKNDFISVPTVDYVKRVCASFTLHKKDVLELIKDFFHSAQLIRLDASVDYGFGDAAVTAVLYGVFWQLMTVVNENVIRRYFLCHKVNIAFAPHYTEKIFEYKIYLSVKIKIVTYIKLYRRAKRLIKIINTEGKN